MRSSFRVRRCHGDCAQRCAGECVYGASDGFNGARCGYGNRYSRRRAGAYLYLVFTGGCVDCAAFRRYWTGVGDCKQLTELLEGDIHLHSVVGQGTVFTLTVPTVPAAPSEPSALAGLHAVVVTERLSMALQNGFKRLGISWQCAGS